MQAFCAAVDWGTSSFRLWVLNARGEVVASRRSDQGMRTLASRDYGQVLESHLAALAAPVDLPVIVCGMAGSRQGWIEAPYITVPATFDALAANAIAVSGFNRDVRIVPGLAQRNADKPDVMRGEETQMMGAFANVKGEMVACLPGTHSKWVSLSSNSVRAFTTFMTGELFDVIGHRTTLLQGEMHASQVHDATVFANAVSSMLDAPQTLTSRLFAIRAGELLGYGHAETSGSMLSGLLIGNEIAAARKCGIASVRVNLVASGQLAMRYRTALMLAGIEVSDSDADQCVIAGLWQVARLVFASPTKRKTG